jgi:Na+-driven multidrug efflux pump
MTDDYLVQKKPFNALLVFSLPIIIGNLFQQTYTMADSAIAGRFVGERALAAIGASYSLTNIFICIAIGGGIGASVMISQYFGAKNFVKMKTAIYTALITFLIISILLGGVGLFFSRSIMTVLNTPDDTLDMAVVYLNIYFIGLPFLFMYNVLSSIFNALGKSTDSSCLFDFFIPVQYPSGLDFRYNISNGNCRCSMGNTDCARNFSFFIFSGSERYSLKK